MGIVRTGSPPHVLLCGLNRGVGALKRPFALVLLCSSAPSLHEQERKGDTVHAFAAVHRRSFARLVELLAAALLCPKPPPRRRKHEVPGKAATSSTVTLRISGDVVVFQEHFFRGFGLPAIDFFSRFLVHFGLQPHHLAPNAVLQLAALVTQCEGFVGIEPRLDFWRQLFFFKQQSMPTDVPSIKRMTPYGAALVHHWSASGIPKLLLPDTVKEWHRGFFYVMNLDPLPDYINLPPFTMAPPIAKLNWNSTLLKPIPEVKQICAHLEILKTQGLLARDLFSTRMACWILPLQYRPHLIYQMGGRHDPCRLSMKTLRAGRIAHQVILISSASMDEGGEWEWGMAPYDRSHPAPTLLEHLQVYQPPAAHVEVSGPIEIEDEDEVELQPSSSEDVEDVAESEDTELVGEFFASTLLDWTDDDDVSPPLRGVADVDDLEELEEEICTYQFMASREAQTAEEGDATAVEQTALAEADAAKMALIEQENRPLKEAARKAAANQAQPNKCAASPAQKLTTKERRSKTKHDPASQANVDAQTDESARAGASVTETIKATGPGYASARVDLDVMPDAPDAGVVITLEALTDAPGTKIPPPDTETALVVKDKTVQTEGP
ncbi:hypothetical protein D1007_32063 [Hordeum vulgare]|nr:hypothetical protein D1007_32063 [Hordeum vulgare]